MSTPRNVSRAGTELTILHAARDRDVKSSCGTYAFVSAQSSDITPSRDHGIALNNGNSPGDWLVFYSCWVFFSLIPSFLVLFIEIYNLACSFVFVFFNLIP